MNSKYIYIKPVNECINNINNKNSNTIFLVGNKNTGKTTVINEYLKNSSLDNPRIDITTRFSEYFIITDLSVYRLYHTCLVVKKMLNYIMNNYEIVNEVSIYDSYVDSIIKNIAYLYFIRNYDSKYELFKKELLDNPVSLINDFNKIIKANYNIDNITYVLDNFDVVGDSSLRYQNTMFKLFNNMKKILVVSDERYTNNKDNLDKLSALGDTVLVDYSHDLETVKEILDKYIVEEFFKNGLIHFSDRIRFILSDDVISSMINKTNGNINDMKKAINYLYTHLKEVNKDNYGSILLNYIDLLNNDMPIVGIIYNKKRTLKIN